MAQLSHSSLSLRDHHVSQGTGARGTHAKSGRLMGHDVAMGNTDSRTYSPTGTRGGVEPIRRQDRAPTRMPTTTSHPDYQAAMLSP